MRVAVVFGGSSVEHEISILTGLQVISALNKSKYQVIPVYLTKENVFTIGKDLEQVETFKKEKKHLKEVLFTRKGLKRPFHTIPIDVIICCVHGRGLEGGQLAGYFEMIGLPYTSNEVMCASLGQDKILMKKVLAYDGLSVVPFVGFSISEWNEKRSEILEKCHELNFPLIVKASNLGSSIGIERPKTIDDLEKAIVNVFQFDDRVIVEEVVKKFREFNCAIINEDKLSLVEEVLTKNDILTFNDKYEDSSSRRIIPADIPLELKNEIYLTTKKVSKIVSNKGVSRIDYLYDYEKDILYVNEINTIPGSMAYYLYEDRGLYFDELLDLLIDNAIKCQYLKTRKINTFKSNVLNMKGIKK